MRWCRYVLCLALSLAAVRLSAFPTLASRPSPATQASWRRVGLPYLLVERRLTERLCTASEAEFLSCIAGLNVLVAQWNDSLVLLPAGAPAALAAEFGRPQVTFGLAQAVGLRPTSETDLETLYRRDRRLHTAVREAWRSQYRATRGKKVDFAGAIGWVKHRFVTKENEAVVTATVLSAQLSDRDPYARLEPSQRLYADAKSNGTDLVGIGVLLKAYHGRLVVMHPLPGGAAERAGIRTNDVLTSLDGKPFVGRTLHELDAPLQGAAHSRLELTVERDGALFTVELERGTATVPHVLASLHWHRGRLVGYLRLDAFNAQVASHVEQAVKALEDGGATSLVLDLRGNNGGNIDAVAPVASVFLSANEPLFTKRFLSPARAPQAVRTVASSTTRLPLMVLVDGNTGSAAELLAGALQDHGRAFLVGERTHGKGTMQEGRELRPGVVLYQTVARLERITGRSPQLVSILPDFPVAPEPEETPGTHFYARADILESNALPADGPAYLPGSAERREQLRHCVERLAPRRLYEARGSQGLPLDFPLLYAADVLQCRAN